MLLSTMVDVPEQERHSVVVEICYVRTHNWNTKSSRRRKKKIWRELGRYYFIKEVTAM